MPTYLIIGSGVVEAMAGASSAWRPRWGGTRGKLFILETQNYNWQNAEIYLQLTENIAYDVLGRKFAKVQISFFRDSNTKDTG